MSENLGDFEKDFNKALKASPHVEDGPNQTVYYSNLAEVQSTPEEVIFHFGLRKKDDFNTGEGVAKIYVSLFHAKRIYESLGKVIGFHEGVFGEIMANADDRVTEEGKIIVEKLRGEKDE